MRNNLTCILGSLQLPLSADGTSNKSAFTLPSTMSLKSTPVLMTSSITSWTSSLISSYVHTKPSKYISPTPSLTQYKSAVLNNFSTTNSSFIWINITSILRPSFQQTLLSLYMSTQSSSTAIPFSTDSSVSLSSKSPQTSKDVSLYSSTRSTKQHFPLSSTYSTITPKLSHSTSTFRTFPSSAVLSANSIQQNGIKQTLSFNIISTSNLVSHRASVYVAKPSKMIKPPPLVPVTTTNVTSSLHGCGIGSCCTHALSQLPARLDFEESKNRGYVMAVIRDVTKVNFTVKVARPLELTVILKDSFNVTATKNGYNFVLNQEIDLEELYDKTDGKVDVHNLQLQISCAENSSVIVPPRMLNVTIDDVDDNMPVFQQPAVGSKDCVVPVYKADTSEDYTGELSLSPGKIEAVDGDVSSKHNISYRVMHSEPEDYHVYFSLDTENGTVHKTKTMNSSNPNKFVIFVQAVEDSPQQKSRVAVLQVVVVAPSDPFSDPNKANPTAKLALQIACAFILMAFICGVVVIVHHRYTLSHKKVGSEHRNELRDMKLPKLAVYQSSNSSLNSTIPEIPDIKSPSQIVVASCENTLRPGKWDFENTKTERRESESQRKRRMIVKKPIDTKSRPSWNAPSPKPKRTRYNPFSVYQTQHTK